MNFAIWSIKNPIPPVLFFITLTLGGLFAIQNFRIQDLPDIEFPQVDVTLTLPGAAPSQLETEIARKVEDSIAGVSGVKHIATSISEGNVTLSVSFDLDKPVSDGLLEIKDAIDQVRPDLPPDLEPPSVAANRINSQALMTFAVSSSHHDEASLSWFVDDTMGKAFRSISGVGRFARVGGVDREIRVEVDPTMMSALKVTAADISEAIKGVQGESSGGQSFLGTAEQSVRTIATVALASELNKLPVPLTDGRHIRLDQVATVRDSHSRRTQVFLHNGNPGIAFQVFGAKGADEVEIAKRTQQVIDELVTRFPGLTITPVVNSVTYTLEQCRGSMRMLYEGAILAVLVVGLFLKDWRATLISAAALPLSIVPTLGIMYWLGYSLNTLSLLALAVVVGILIDDAIVEIENIVRHKQMGKTTLSATMDAVSEIALAVIATTLTIVVVFLPTALMGGITGLLFKQFGWTVVISVFMSLLVARLITPLMAAYLLKNDGKPVERPDGIIMSKYLEMVHWCLLKPKTTLFMATAFFGSTLYLATHLVPGFISPSDLGYTNLNFELSPGSTLDDSLRTAEILRREVEKVDGVENSFTTIGQTKGDDFGPQAGGVRKGNMIITFIPKEQRRNQSEIVREIRSILPLVPGAKFALKNDGPGEAFSLALASDNMESLTNTARQLERELRASGLLSNLNSTISLQQPEINIRPNFARMAELGVTAETISDTVRVATAGDFNPRLSKLNLENRQLNIRVLFPEESLNDLQTLANLRIPTHVGTTTLANLAAISLKNGPSQIDRYDRQRYITVSADLGGVPLGQALDSAMSLPALLNKPSHVTLVEMGEAEIMGELFKNFGVAMLAGVLLVLCVLILLFKDFFQPLTILSALPLSFGGAIIALLITSGEIGLTALVGIIMLLGIVCKNSILLVEYTIVGMKVRNLSRYDALIDACHKRARPIIMTTVAMIAGMAPIAIGIGGDGFRQPMAIAVIGGLVTSTALSLLVVPVVFTYVNKAENWIIRKVGPLQSRPSLSDLGPDGSVL